MSIEAMTPKEIIEAVQGGTPLIAPRCGGKRLTLSILAQMKRLIELEEEYRKLKEGAMTDTKLPENIQLSPCPHCGNTQLVGRQYPGKDGFLDQFAILCHYGNGGCGAESGHYHTLEEAMSNWNKRASVNMPTDMSGYESPIKLTVMPLETELKKTMDSNTETWILEACQRVGVQVDADELVKAIKGERDQYSAGYQAGYLKGREDSWLDFATDKPNDRQTIFLYTKSGDFDCGIFRADYQEVDCDVYQIPITQVSGWMPCTFPHREGG